MSHEPLPRNIGEFFLMIFYVFIMWIIICYALGIIAWFVGGYWIW